MCHRYIPKPEKKICPGPICRKIDKDQINDITKAFHIAFLWDPTSIEHS